MKPVTLALLSLAICAALGTAAQAEHITFTGQVVKTTCIPSVNGSGVDATVELHAVSGRLLAETGMTAGETPFIIDLTGCSITSPNTIKAYFWQSNAKDGRLSGTESNPGTGTGWQYEITAGAENQPVKVGNNATVVESNNANDPGVDVGVSGKGTLNYRVRYYRSGDTLVHGPMTAVANYVLFSN